MYSLIVDDSGKVFRVVKYVIDIISCKMVVNDICEIMLLMLKGSLVGCFECEYEGEFEILVELVNDFVINLFSIIFEICGGLEIINNVFNEIVRGNVDLFFCIE